MAIIKQPQHKFSIGIFDSGVGGLTVVKAIRKKLPKEDLIYLGDTARTPYGSKAGETVVRFTRQCIRYLMQHKIKALVVACNTASAYTLPMLRRNFKIPIIGVIQPGAHAAVASCIQGPIGVIGTKATVKSNAYTESIQRLNHKCRVVSQSCPLLVPLVEEGWLDGPIPKNIIKTYLSPMLRKEIRSLILGCTHYPALKPVLQKVCGKRVRIIDSAEEVAKALEIILDAKGLRNMRETSGKQKYLVTDIPEQFIRVGSTILGRPISNVQRIAVLEE
ncbi:glutamate racemase [bacterium]|nr:glutamate racemase [bacterium]